jgi:hypothetical protein
MSVMKASGSKRKRLLAAAVPILAVALALLAVEIGLRAAEWVRVAWSSGASDAAPAEFSRCACPFLYGLNPGHPANSSQGLRDRDYSYERSAAVKRILVLGDSVTYGSGVERERVFTELLEAASSPEVEVINAGVPGYTPFNELYYYLEEGRKFKADLVIAVLVLNDVVNPRLHINYPEEGVGQIPEEAIPNHEYDRTHIRKRIEEKKRLREHERWYEELAVYRALLGPKQPQGGSERWDDPRRNVTVDGRAWPVFVTGEDTLSIQVLMDYDSAEWRWLRLMYGRLVEAVRGDGSGFLMVIVPLSYQLQQGYPFLPQQQLQRYCESLSIDCLDLLPVLKAQGGETNFMGEHDGYYDVWHLSEHGHRTVAAALERHLSASGFLENAKQPVALSAEVEGSARQ